MAQPALDHLLKGKTSLSPDVAVRLVRFCFALGVGGFRSDRPGRRMRVQRFFPRPAAGNRMQAELTGIYLKGYYQANVKIREKDKIRILSAVVLLAGVLTTVPLWAEDSPPEMIQAALAARVGQKLTVKLISGEELTGTVRRVGDDLIHLGDLTGKEYFDALISVRAVTAVIYRRPE